MDSFVFNFWLLMYQLLRVKVFCLPDLTILILIIPQLLPGQLLLWCECKMSLTSSWVWTLDSQTVVFLGRGLRDYLEKVGCWVVGFQGPLTHASPCFLMGKPRCEQAKPLSPNHQNCEAFLQPHLLYCDGLEPLFPWNCFLSAIHG